MWSLKQFMLHDISMAATFMFIGDDTCDTQCGHHFGFSRPGHNLFQVTPFICKSWAQFLSGHSFHLQVLGTISFRSLLSFISPGHNFFQVTPFIYKSWAQLLLGHSFHLQVLSTISFIYKSVKVVILKKLFLYYKLKPPVLFTIIL